MRAPDSRNYQSRQKRGKSFGEARLAHDFGDRVVGVLGQHRIQLAIDSANCARAFFHQGRSDLHRPGARQVRNVCVAAAADSADCYHVEQIFALFEKRMRLRERARRSLDCSAGDVD